MNRAFFLLAFSALLSACAAPTPTPQASQPLYYFVTAAPNATPTPTPFQPSPAFTASPAAHVPAPVVTPLPTQVPAPQPTPPVFSAPPPLVDVPESLTILLLGSDLRSGQSYRTDTIIVAALRPQDGQVSLISFPRDLWVNIPTVGMQRINTAYQYGEAYAYPGGGAGLLKETLLQNFGLPIDHTALLDFDGFRRVVDTLGGVDVPVACAYTDWRLIDPSYDPQNEANWALFTAPQGVLHMDGDYALWYARSRQKSDDFDRARRQQEVLRALYAQALRTDSLSRLPQLYEDFRTTISTDLDLAALLRLSPLALHLTNADIRSYYIANDLVVSWVTPGGAYVLLPNPEAVQQMLTEALQPSLRLQTSQSILVEVQNGSPYEGWDALAAERLNYAGYETILRPADARTHAQTLLYDLTASQDRSLSNALLASLRLPPEALVSVPAAPSAAPYVLLLGADYSPCFNPQQPNP